MTAVGEYALDAVVIDFHALHVALLHIGDEIGIVDGLASGLGGAEIIEDRHQDDGDDYPEHQIFYEIVQTYHLTMAAIRRRGIPTFTGRFAIRLITL
jgi:hypothetical protein